MYFDSPDLTLYKYWLISFISVHCASPNHTYAAVAAADLLKKSRKSTPLNRQKAGKLGENGECPCCWKTRIFIEKSSLDLIAPVQARVLVVWL